MYGFPGSSAGKEYTCNAGDAGFDSWVVTIPWRRERLPTPVFLGFRGGTVGKESACSAGDLGSIPGSLGRSPGEGKGYPLQSPGLENSVDCIILEVAESDTTERLITHFHVHIYHFWAPESLQTVTAATKLRDACSLRESYEKPTAWLCFKSLLSCLTLRDPVDCSPPGSSVHGVLWARTLQWVAMPSSRVFSQPRDRSQVSCIFCIGKQIPYH